MSLCKTLAGTSLPSLGCRTQPPRHFSFLSSSTSLLQSNRSNRRGIQSKPYASLISSAIAIEPADDLTKDTVVQLLSPHNMDRTLKLMKMERKPLNYQFQSGNPNPSSTHWFPYLDKLIAGDVCLSSGEVLQALESHILDVRKEKFRNVVKNRSYGVCLVVEGLSDLGNVSATFRSADALGFQSVHVVSLDSKRWNIV